MVPWAGESERRWIKGRISRERKFETWWLQKWMKMMHYNKRCPYTPSDFIGF
jgi:hypothetical protein